ncbi:hypothetical protein HDU77_002700 [Chytriomyces hyalinus]|nr:hypothetical protein HDU77_002700 [Chytriomyces hyalinus]
MSSMIHPLMGRAVAGRPEPCERCRKKRRKCDLRRPTCDRCLRTGQSCEWRGGHSQSPPAPNSPTSNLINRPHGYAAQNGRTARVKDIDGDVPKIEDSMPQFADDTPLLIEDPDLLPSFYDFALVLGFFAQADVKTANDSPAFYLVDGDSFLATFFQQPAALRLTLCAIAAFNADPPLPKKVYLWYYDRAKKAVVRHLTKPSLEGVQTLFLISHFYMIHGQPASSRELMIRAVQMAIALNLGVDPSNDVTLSHSQQTEHRRIFWRLFFHIKYSKCVENNLRPYDLLRHDILPPSGPGSGVRGESPLMVHACLIWDLIYAIELHWVSPPTSLTEMLLSVEMTRLNSKLIEVHAQLPSFYVLVPDIRIRPEDTDALMNQNEVFVAQLMAASLDDSTAMLALSLNYNASICLLLRPRMCISAFMHPSSKNLSQEYTFLIESALEECSSAAQRIAHLTQFILHLIDANSSSQHIPGAHPAPQVSNPSILSKSFWMQQVILCQAIFEAAICLWVIGCRVQRAWFASPNVQTLPTMETVTQHLNCLLHFFTQLSNCYETSHQDHDHNHQTTASKKPNMATPFIHCISGMLHELSFVELHGGPLEVVKDSPEDTSRLNRIVLDMKAMAISDSEEDEIEVVVAGRGDPPVAYLGLLGLEVDDRFRWKSANEERRKCDMTKPHCLRCSKMGVTCEYPPEEREMLRMDETVKDDPHFDGYVRLVLPASPQSAATSVSTGSEVPTSGVVEELDMVATYSDYMLCHGFFAAGDLLHASDSPAYYLIDREKFLSSFFTQPPALRLVICTLAAFTTDLPLPKHLYVSYYLRAKKALLRCIHKPALQTLQALYLTTTFILVNGQPTIGEKLFTESVKMAIALNLGVDPSHNPLLTQKFGPVLSASQQEEYRRVFWRIYYNLKYEKCVSDVFRPLVLQRIDVRLPSGGVRGQTPLMEHQCALWDLIYLLRTSYDEPPKSALEILESQATTVLTSRLIEELGKIPSTYILTPELSRCDHADDIMGQNEAFVGQMVAVSPTDTTGMLLLSVNYNASICMLLRPKICLTVFLNPEESSAFTSDHVFLLQSALDECSAAAQRIAELNDFILYLTETDSYRNFGNSTERAASATPNAAHILEKSRVVSRSFWMQQIIQSHAIFEAAVCLWVISCRTRPAWFHKCTQLTPLPKVQGYLERISRYFKILSQRFGKEDSTTKPNMMTPFIDCLDAMLYELSLVETRGSNMEGDSPVSPFGWSGVDRIVLDMKAMGISDLEEVMPGSSECPLAYLGLLGLEVNEVFQWKGENEDAWRKFWMIQFPSSYSSDALRDFFLNI